MNKCASTYNEGASMSMSVNHYNKQEQYVGRIKMSSVEELAYQEYEISKKALENYQLQNMLLKNREQLRKRTSSYLGTDIGGIKNTAFHLECVNQDISFL